MSEQNGDAQEADLDCSMKGDRSVSDSDLCGKTGDTGRGP